MTNANDDQDPPGSERRSTPSPNAHSLAALGGPLSHEAVIQEMKAGTAPLVRIIPITAQVPERNQTGRFAIATVPFLTVSALRWNRVTIGDPVGRLVQLLQEHGGVWLAKNTTSTLAWSVSPAADDSRSDMTAGGTASAPVPWVRLDAAFTGAWTGRFALAASAPRLAANLWCLAASPLVGIVPDEVADRALPTADGAEPVPWTLFTEALDNTVHTTTQPAEDIRDLVIRSSWPRSETLRKRKQ